MDPASTILKLLAVLLLVGINAFFVAAEFALVAVRRTRIEPLARAGDKRAQRVLAALDHPDDFISAAQLGITVSSIAIGYIAEGTLHAILVPYLLWLHATGTIPVLGTVSITGHVIATILTLIIVTFLHVVLGEQVPKMMAIQKAESVAFWATRPTQIFGSVFRPFIRLMSMSAGAVMRMFGVPPTGVHAHAHTPEEIRLLVEQSHQEGMVEADQQMLLGVFQFRDTIAREVMTPRRDIIALETTATRAETLALVAEEGHSRIPVYRESIDEIVGILLVKDLLANFAQNQDADAPFTLQSLVREPYFVPDTKRIGELLSELRARSAHMAILLDEFGGTEGLVTLEDMLEEIVGDIRDEYDEPEDVDFQLTDTGDVLIDGGTSIFEVNERFGLRLPEEDFDTIGGFVFGELGRVPVPGDIVSLNGRGDLRVEDVEERRVTRVRLIPPVHAYDEPATPTDEPHDE
jgi:CBS domain containing-hemolysin-like protein